jgi:hypothetical protein
MLISLSLRLEQAYVIKVLAVATFHPVCINRDGQPLGTVALSLGVATDVFTAASLSYFLHKMRTGYKRCVLKSVT